MGRGIPPLNPLRAFEVASRLQSFTRAADELNVTQSAVSRQIATLEAYLNTLLFRRDRGGVTLTATGERYRRVIGPVFAQISAATLDLQEERQTKPLRLRVYYTFAAKWLIPRLPCFNERHPDIQVQLSTSVAPVNFSRDSVDLAIQFGDGCWDGLQQQLVVRDRIQPVCSPGYIERHEPVRSVDDLLRRTLLSAHYRRRDWPDWLAKAGHRGGDLPAMMEFPSSLLAYQAALEGLGVAMGQTPLLHDDIGAGRLVPLLDESVTRDMGYYALWSEELSPSRNMEAFLDWLQEQSMHCFPQPS